MFFFPLFDDNPSQRTPWVAWMIIAVCVLVFIWQQSLPPQAERLAYYQFGFVPANASGAALLPSEIVVVPAWATVITAMFLHGGWMHIGGNMLYLWIFGDNVEDSMGPSNSWSSISCAVARQPSPSLPSIRRRVFRWSARQAALRVSSGPISCFIRERRSGPLF